MIIDQFVTNLLWRVPEKNNIEILSIFIEVVITKLVSLLFGPPCRVVKYEHPL